MSWGFGYFGDPQHKFDNPQPATMIVVAEVFSRQATQMLTFQTSSNFVKTLPTITVIPTYATNIASNIAVMVVNRRSLIIALYSA